MESQSFISEPSNHDTQSCGIAQDETQEEQQVVTPSATPEATQDTARLQTTTDVSTQDTTGKAVSESDEEGSKDEDEQDNYTHEPPSKIRKSHPIQNVIGNATEGRGTRNTQRINYRELAEYMCYTYLIEPKNVKEALEDDYSIAAM